MYLRTKEGIIDFDMELLVATCRVVNDQLDAFEKRFQAMPDAEGSAEFDWAEHVAGLVFVACQSYLTATYAFARVPKGEAMQLGPKHNPSGRPIVVAINAAANFWKHYPEWPLDKRPDRQNAVRLAFDGLGFPADGEYPLSGILTELTNGVARFAQLVEPLEQWRNDALAKEAQQAGCRRRSTARLTCDVGRIKNR